MAAVWITSLVLVVLYWLFFRQKRLQIPGPRGWPLFGCIFQIDSGKSHVTLTEWTKKYGPVFSIKFFTNDVVVVNSYDSIMDVLVNRGNVFGGRPRLFRSELTSQYQDIINANSDSPHWSVLRKVTHKYVKLLSTGTDDLERRISNTIDTSMKRLAKHNGNPVNMYHELQTFALSTIFFLVFGEEVNEHNNEFQMVQDALRLALPSREFVGKGLLLDQFPWLRFFPNESYKRLKMGLQLLWSLWEIKRDQANKINDKSIQSVLQAMAEMRNKYKDSNNKPLFNDINFRGVMVNLVVAGIATTTASLHAFISLLLNFPETRSKLKEEVDKVLGKDRTVNVSDRENMPYTRAAILELLRYTSVVPLGLPHATLQDTEINGYSIPQGTMVMINLWHLHHDEKFWGDPWNYRPDRFLDDTGNLVMPDHPNRRHLLPFGAGTRVCIGELFALNRMFLYIVTLLQKFELLPEENGKLPPYDPRSYVAELAIRPEEFKVRVVPR